MASDGWKLHGNRAQATVGRLEATVDLQRPDMGVHHARWDGRPLDERTRLLGVLIPRPADAEIGPLADRYVQRRRLVAVYGPGASRPVHVSIAWTLEPGEIAAIGCTVSVWTDRLRADPGLGVESWLVAAGVRRLAGGSEGQEVAPASEPVVQGRAEPGCWLFPLVEVDAQYVQMVHPGDRFRDELATAGDVTRPAIQLCHHLFADPLEKGVILRARVRGGFGPGSGDWKRVAESYQAFAESEPPLSS